MKGLKTRNNAPLRNIGIGIRGHVLTPARARNLQYPEIPSVFNKSGTIMRYHAKDRSLNLRHLINGTYWVAATPPVKRTNWHGKIESNQRFGIDVEPGYLMVFIILLATGEWAER